jgi:Flp pilus assembly protein TadG
MMVRSDHMPNRRGTSIVECAVVFPVTMLLLIGTMVVGIIVFRYEQLQFLASEGARYASVHGPTYASDSGLPVASTSDIQTHVLTPLANGLAGVSCTAVSYSSASAPCTVAVTLTYTSTPEAYFSAMTWTATSTLVVTY